MTDAPIIETFVTPLNWTTLLDVSLLAMMVAVAFVIVKLRHLFAVVMLSGVYSLLSAMFFVSLDAVDVAFTEAAVGAGVSTVLMLGAMLLTTRREKPVLPQRAPVALLVVLVTGGALVYATVDMPAFGDPLAPANDYVGHDYIERTPSQVGHIPNIVTAVLASYRGFDTLGETLVVFTAGMGVVMLLWGSGSGRKRDDSPEDGEGGGTT